MFYASSIFRYYNSVCVSLSVIAFILCSFVMTISLLFMCFILFFTCFLFSRLFTLHAQWIDWVRELQRMLSLCYCFSIFKRKPINGRKSISTYWYEHIPHLVLCKYSNWYINSLRKRWITFNSLKNIKKITALAQEQSQTPTQFTRTHLHSLNRKL